jgi:PleD family two-component response regulator
MLNTSPTTNKNNWAQALGIENDTIPVLIIGNNPIEMTSIYNILIGIRSRNYLADVCFNVKDSFDRISKSKPELIFIDDNLLLDDVKKMIRILKHNAKTKDIKIITLKSSNWGYKIIDDVDDYILKDAINTHKLDRLIQKNLNSLVNQLA